MRQRQRQQPAWRHVYFMQHPDGAIKIGMSSNPSKRLTTIRRELKADVTLLGWCKAGPRCEGCLHRWFSSCRLDGEWFEPTEELLGVIDECLEANDVPYRIMRGRSAQ